MEIVPPFFQSPLEVISTSLPQHHSLITYHYSRGISSRHSPITYHPSPIPGSGSPASFAFGEHVR
jgi:hypothetical protein